MKYLLPVLCLLLSVDGLLLAQNAPDFTIDGTDNQQHELYSDYLNNGKTVVLEIMFTTCPPCNSIAPLVETLNQDWGAGQQDVVFISLSDKSFDDNSDVLAWENMHGLSYHGAGQDGGSLSAVAPYKAGTYGPFLGTPTFVVIAPDGTVNYNPRGASQSRTIDSIDLAIEQTGASRPQTQFTLGGLIAKEGGTPIANVEVSISNQNTPDITSTDGNYQFFPIDIGSTVSVKPFRAGNPRNGLSVLDLVMIQRHLLLIDLFDSPYQYFAADVNKSKNITPLDLVLMQRTILFIDNEFPNNTNWRFIPSDYDQFLPGNPLAISPPDSIVYNSVSQDDFQGNFVAIKTGDVSGNANPSNLIAPIVKAPQMLSYPLIDRVFAAGERFELTLPLFEVDQMNGFQMGLKIDPSVLHILEVEKDLDTMPGELMINSDDQDAGLLRFCWFGAAMSPQSDLTMATIHLEAQASGRLSDLLSLDQESLPFELYRTLEDGRLESHELQLDYEQLTTGIKNIDFEASIYPNPTSDYFSIRLERPTNTQQQITLLDHSGKVLVDLVESESGKGALNTVFSLATYPPGLYLIRLSDSTHKPLIIKLVKQ